MRTSTRLAAMVLNVGVSVEELSRVSGVPAREILDPTLISYDDGLRLWDAAEVLTGDPFVGLSAGARVALEQLGALGAAFTHAADLREALSHLARLLPLVIEGASVALELDDDEGRFVYRSPSTARHGVDAMFAAIVSSARRATGRALRLREVWFQSPAPATSTPYVELFGVRPRWDEPTSRLAFAREDLDAPMRGADPGLARLLEAHAPALLGTEPGGTELERRVARAMREAIEASDPSVDRVARALALSGRSLQRRLREAGTSFSEVRDAALRERAEALLADGALGIDAIAERLGFANRTTFERAYRRWSGRTPAAARRRAR
ncbi:MAG: AraC family transcriptional regulator [Sandaracinaceae bacterium]|nr:AraC family transcriptional regulator [Sandaracinaceae bacterium]